MPLSITAKIEYHERAVNLQIDGFETYEEYRLSRLWKRIRTRVRRRDKSCCVLCGKRGKRLEPHHLSYSLPVLRGKRLSEIALLCRVCHEYVERDGGGKRSPSEARRWFLFLYGYHNGVDWFTGELWTWTSDCDTIPGRPSVPDRPLDDRDPY